jgi:tetratricopeptide (TPR) repeat protein
MNKKYFYLIIIFLIIASLLAFGRIAGNDFVNFDDTGYITENDHVQSGFSPQNIKWAATAVVVSNWHPLTMLSHMLDWKIFGANASGHHLVSLLLHIGAVIFLFLFLYKTTNRIWPSALAAAFFALHPLRVESVAWASERKDVLSMFFGMAALYAYAFYVEVPRLSRYFLCLILFALALMSKPMMVTLPFVLMLLDYWPLNRWQKTSAKVNLHPTGKLILEKIPFLLLTMASGIITFWAQNKEGSVASADIVPFLTRTANAVFSYAAYLEKTFRPVNLAVFYPYDFFIPLWKTLLSFTILLLITVAVLYYIRKLPFLFVGWFWYLGTFIPVIGLVQVGTQAMADRYTYLPSVGIAMMLAWGIPSLIKNEFIREKILFPAALTVIIIISVLTWQQCGYWRDSTSLFNHALRVTKNNDKIHNVLGSFLDKKGRNNEAVYHYNKAIQIAPYHYGYYNNRGKAYAIMGEHKKSIEDYNKSISLKPDYADAYYNRGTLYGKTGQYQFALEDFNKAISLAPEHIKAFNNRGIVHTKLGLFQEALNDLNKAISLKHDYADAWNNRAFVYLKQDDNIAGCSNAKKACEWGNCATLQTAAVKGLCR